MKTKKKYSCVSSVKNLPSGQRMEGSFLSIHKAKRKKKKKHVGEILKIIKGIIRKAVGK